MKGIKTFFALFFVFAFSFVLFKPVVAHALYDHSANVLVSYIEEKTYTSPTSYTLKLYNKTWKVIWYETGYDYITHETLYTFDDETGSYTRLIERTYNVY